MAEKDDAHDRRRAAEGRRLLQSSPLSGTEIDYMTREAQKRRERFFVEETAKLLGKTWDLGQDREHPDFVIRDEAQRFGLEVCEVFMGREQTSATTLGI